VLLEPGKEYLKALHRKYLSGGASATVALRQILGFCYTMKQPLPRWARDALGVLYPNVSDPLTLAQQIVRELHGRVDGPAGRKRLREQDRDMIRFFVLEDSIRPVDGRPGRRGRLARSAIERELKRLGIEEDEQTSRKGADRWKRRLGIKNGRRGQTE